MKRILAVAVAASALTLTAACGSSDAGSTSGSSSSAASSSSSSAAAASVKQGDTVSMATLGQRMSAAMKEKGTAKLAMQSSMVNATGAMKMSQPQAYTMSMKASGRSVDMIYVDKTLYLGGDSFSSMLGGKKWVKIDPNGSDAFSKQMAPTLKQMESATDPSKMYASMSDVKATVTKVEGGDVTYTTKLTGDQVKAYAEKQGQSLPSGTDVGDLTLTMTVDKDGLPSTVSTDVMGQAIKMTYSDWGTKVDIKAPPASEVGTMPAS